jgi:hypothetical protein
MIFLPWRIGRVGASTMRRVILRLSVGGVPPYWSPSGACLTLGSSRLYQPPNATADYPTPGPRLFQCPLEPFRVACS